MINPAFAQQPAAPPVSSQAKDEALEEVVVTGLRASLEASMDIKRDAVGVVDAITAEDMGKFPDTNLAESLQRITGISIDRRNGEGAQVSARGFGPQFNLVTLNGRPIPGADGFGNGEITIGGQGSGTRSFNFAQLAVLSGDPRRGTALLPAAHRVPPQGCAVPALRAAGRVAQILDESLLAGDDAPREAHSDPAHSPT